MTTTTIRVDSVGKGKRTRLDNGEMLALIHEGHTLEEVAAAYGMLASTIAGRLNHMGYDRYGEPLPVNDTPTRQRVVKWDRDNQPWQHAAACRTGGHDPEMWHPASAVERATVGRVAKGICSGCPVATQCLQLALRAEGTLTADYRSGIFGGLDEQQRADLAKRGVA